MQTNVPSMTSGQQTKRFRKDRGATKWMVLIALSFVALACVVPLAVLAVNAFKSTADYSSNGPLSLPTVLSLEGFVDFLNIVDFPVVLTNSIVISTFVALFGCLLSMLAGYAIGVGRVKGSMWIIGVFLLATMLPQEALIYPLFYGFQSLGLLNSSWSVIIVFSVLQGAFGTYLLSSVMGTIPAALLEAAQLDGASRWKILWSIVFPLVRPTLGVLMVFFFIWTWNEFYIPLVLLSQQSAQTVPIAIATLKGQNSMNVVAMNAGALLSILPTLLFFVVFQRTLTRGVAVGAVK